MTCLLQILGIETFGEPVIDWLQQIERFLVLALYLPQPRERTGGA